MILAIESSCDEVSVALVGHDYTVRKNILYSSAGIANATGGVVPEMAARKAEQNIAWVITQAMDLVSLDNISAIAVTCGYGLLGSLFTGIEAAKTLAFLWKKPLIPVFHTFGHMCAPMLGSGEGVFPRMVLSVSGGHNEIILWKSPLQWERIGKSIDDAAGECFDKCARMLGLGYPGGPLLSALAKTATGQHSFSFPRPMMHAEGFDMSFSGLKTAVLYAIEKNGGIGEFSQEQKADAAQEIEKAIVEVLLARVAKAMKVFEIRHLEITGGVSANTLLREEANSLCIKKKWTLRMPQKIEFCTDNGAMIGAAANCIWQHSIDKTFDFRSVSVITR